MRVLVAGSTGQVGTELGRVRWPERTDLRLYDRAGLDITDPEACDRIVATLRPDVVINAAAYTAVDKAEGDVAAAMAANRDGPRHLARAAAAANVPLLHLSTDYVFDGEKPARWTEGDAVAPLGVYGTSKEAGERAIRAELDRHLILRTAWVYAAHGHNFVRTMLRLAATHDTLRIVADQHGTPTAARDIAEALARLAVMAVAGEIGGKWGTYNMTCGGATTWHGFAEAIFAIAGDRLPRRPTLQAITTADYPTPARRPANSVLDCSKLERALGIALPSWRESLSPVLDELLGPAI